MSTALGIHISEQCLRVVYLEKSEDSYSLKDVFNQAISTPFDFNQDTDPPESLINEFTQALESKLPHALPSISFALTGGLYHIQKVPLEVAGKEDRKDQIVWETTQALISPPQDAIIDFIPAGRVAFWIAVHKRVVEIHERLCRDLGDVSLSFTVEPLALFYAGKATNVWQPGRQAAIHLTMPWSSFVSVEDGLLTAAETVRTPKYSNTQIHQIQQWISGDLAGSPRRSPHNEVFLSGQAKDISQNDINSTSDTNLTEYPGLRDIDTTQLQNQAQLDHSPPSTYTVAIGAATHNIVQAENPDNV